MRSLEMHRFVRGSVEMRRLATRWIDRRLARRLLGMHRLAMRLLGTRWLAMLLGIVFFSHQLGGFLGVWLGGLLFEQSGSYDGVWWLAIALGVLSALINLPIAEKPVHRAEPVPA